MAALVIVYYAFILLEWKNFFLFIVPVMSYIYLPFLMLSRRKIDGLIQNLWAAQSGLMLCVYAMSFAPGLLFLIGMAMIDSADQTLLIIANTASMLAVMTAYTRVLGAAIGTKHYFSGPMAKQHRMAILTFTVITVIRRLLHISNELKGRAK